MADKPLAFVLMPYGDEFDDIFTELIAPALEEAGFEVRRADSMSHQRNILEDIVEGVHQSDLVVADLTALNPNVFYELGMTHGLNKPAILITQEVEEVPFDLRPYRMMEYGVRFTEAPKLREELTKIASQALKDALSFGNPVSDFLRLEAPRVKVILPAEAPPPPLEPGAEEEPEEEKGLLDWLDDSLEATEEATECLNRIAEATQEIGQTMQDRTRQVEEASRGPVRGVTTRVRRIARETAKEIDDYAEIMEHEVDQFSRSWDRVEANTTPWLEAVPIETPENIEALRGLRPTYAKLGSVTEKSLEATRTYRDAVGKIQGITGDLTRASRRTTKVLDRLIAVAERQYAFSLRVLSIIDHRLETFEASHEQ